MAQSCFRSLGHFARVAVASLAILFASGTQAQGGQALLGIYYGNQGWDMAQVRAMENWQKKSHAVVVLFTDWCNSSQSLDNLFKQQLPNIWANGNVPVITWEPYLCSPNATPSDVMARAARGEYDAYVEAWANRLKAFVSGPDGALGTADDRRVYIRLAHEMNGNWYPWSAPVGGTSASYVTMWQRVRTLFSTKGFSASTVQWIWTVNHEDVGSVRAEDYYPGDAYVDWIGIDGYNWGSSQSWSSWRAPNQVFGTMIGRLRGITAKPLAITETAASTAMPGKVDVNAKSSWISQLFEYATNAAGARMIVWFNEDKETDWAVFGGKNGEETYRSGRTTYKAYRSYRAVVQSDSLIPSSPKDVRLISDTRFAGGW